MVASRHLRWSGLFSEGVRATERHQWINCVAQEFHTVADHSADARLVIQLPAGDRHFVHFNDGAQCLNARTLDLGQCYPGNALRECPLSCCAQLLLTLALLHIPSPGQVGRCPASGESPPPVCRLHYRVVTFE